MLTKGKSKMLQPPQDTNQNVQRHIQMRCGTVKLELYILVEYWNEQEMWNTDWTKCMLVSWQKVCLCRRPVKKHRTHNWFTQCTLSAGTLQPLSVLHKNDTYFYEKLSIMAPLCAAFIILIVVCVGMALYCVRRRNIIQYKGKLFTIRLILSKAIVNLKRTIGDSAKYVNKCSTVMLLIC